jgi:hypothetical protein
MLDEPTRCANFYCGDLFLREGPLQKWLACQKFESDGPADCTVVFIRRRRFDLAIVHWHQASLKNRVATLLKGTCLGLRAISQPSLSR